MNLRILEIALDSVDSQHYIDRRIMALLVIVEAVWTHGMMEALSDFVFQSIAIHWYFNEKKLGKDYGKISNNLCPTLALTVKHIGTIIFGHVLAYIPESINLILNRCQTSCKGCYDFCCVFHRCTFKDLSKYCYSKTVLQSKSFCEANNEMS